jgi:hypothetical protein
MICGMARYRHTVTLEPIPRRWFDGCVELGHETLGEFLGARGDPVDPEFRLIEGAALRPGARYGAVDGSVELELLAWGPQTDTAGRVRFADGDAMVDATVRLSTAAAPHLVAVDAELRRMAGRHAPSLRPARVEVRADLTRWWSGVARRGSDPAISIRASHRLFRASFDLTPAPGSGGRWAVTVTARISGRTALRPLTALMLFWAGRRIRTGFAERLDQFAARWNTELPDLMAKNPDELRELIAAELTAARAGRSPRQPRRNP